MTSESLGDRMKRYEKASEGHLTPKLPVIIRVDGRAFHTLTKDMERPFDTAFVEAMKESMAYAADQMQGFQLAYTQSDEISFLLRDDENFDSMPWFGYDQQKLVSVTASIVSSAFLFWLTKSGIVESHSLPSFDGRVFQLPERDVANYFVWRQRDWIRNSVRMMGYSLFTHKQLDKINNENLKNMLRKEGHDWDNLDPALKYGTYYLGRGRYESEKTGYDRASYFSGYDAASLFSRDNQTRS